MIDTCPTRTGPRFGLKALFALITLVALGLGYLAMKAKWHADVTRRHNAILDQLISNLSQPPSGTANLKSNISVDRQKKVFGQHWSGWESILDGLSGQGLINSMATTEIQLDVANAADLGRPPALIQRIAQHYETGLNKSGLNRNITGITAGFPSYRTRAVWSGDGTTVLVDVSMAIDQTSSASVQLLILDHQEFHLW